MKFEPQAFGKYTLMEKLAVGGMAEIYKAKTFGAEGFEKLLAIKKILPHAAADKEFITMLIDEAKLSVLLSHANIVQVYDLGKVGNDYFISMEYIHGVNLRDILYRLREKNQRLPTELAVFVASEISKGLDYAHRKTDPVGEPLGIVHRDISPQNVLISFEGEVKIVDFGIAKAAMNISHTMAGILKGKIAYMSPEQAMGKQVDARTDIFSLGILLYEALSGKKLYTGESQFEVLKKIRTTRITAAKLPDSIPAPLRTVLGRALAYAPEERYPFAGDMQVALTKFLYATYTDFSPRKLSTFIKDFFPEELKKDESLAHPPGEKLPEAKTSSINTQQATQENIVHRTTVSETALPPIALKSITYSETHARLRRARWPWVAALSLFLAAGGWAFWKWGLPPQGAVAAVTGTLQVISHPEGAAIFLNGEATSFKTPAILESLRLKQDYRVRVALENYAEAEKSVALSGPEPQTIDFTLLKNEGVLNIISEPSGASILLNGLPSGKVTPTLLEKLSLQAEYKITLSKPGFEDFEQTVTLMSASPQRLMASLKPLEIPAAPPVAPPVPPPTPPAPPVAPPTTPPAEIVGSIRVRSDPPGAKIYLNGKNTGKVTPAGFSDLKKGRYTIKLTRENFDPVVRRVEIASAKEYTIEEQLKEIAAPPPSPPAAGGEATLQVTSSPSGAELFVNGELKGTTPATVKIAAGAVKVLVTKGGDTLPCKRSLDLRGGQRESIHCTLGDLFGKVEISTNPPRAEVFLNGEKLGGKTPLTIKKVKRDREHTLRVVLNGFKPWVHSFSLQDSDSKAFNIELEK